MKFDTGLTPLQEAIIEKYEECFDAEITMGITETAAGNHVPYYRMVRGGSDREEHFGSPRELMECITYDMERAEVALPKEYRFRFVKTFDLVRFIYADSEDEAFEKAHLMEDTLDQRELVCRGLKVELF